MKFQIVCIALFAIFAISMAVPAPAPAPAPEGDDTHAETLRLESENNGVDKYSFAYETSNGISRSEEGELKTLGEENAAIVVHGTTSWTAPDGKKYEIVFTADETGYHPSFKLAA